ncbi:MAG: efflux RND transporter periplasmic adaptor subunit [Candidatus Cloacimonetes bacterium]|nr:efflux RND transporter periplasmic adaptor subunit [Candidatus Cloacimonadota bacterium]
MNFKRIIIILAAILIVGIIFRLTIGKKAATSGGASWNRSGLSGRAIPVTAENVTEKDFRDISVFTGDIEPAYNISIPSRITARIEKIYKKPGDFVKAHELIANLEDKEQLNNLSEARASYELAKAQLREAQSNSENLGKELQRAETLFESGFMAEAQIEIIRTKHLTGLSSLELAKAQLAQREANLNTALLKKSYTNLYSPREGFVGDLNFDEGSIINQNTVFTTVVSIDSVICEINVSEKLIPRLKEGMAATAEISDRNQKKYFEGKIYSISPIVNKQSRTAAVQMMFNNPDYILKPGMFARISILLEQRNSVPAVPEKSLVEYKQVKGVFMVNGDSTVTFVPTEVGLSEDGYVEIVSEVKISKVVTEGQFMLSDGSKIILPDGDKKQEKGMKKNEG